MIFGNDTSSVFLATEVTNEGVEGGREEKAETGHAQHPEQHRCAQRLPHFRACSGRNGEWGNALPGQLDDLRVYAGVLSDAEITQLATVDEPPVPIE